MLALALACRRGTAVIAALALLLAQAIGLAHAVAHPHANGVVATGAIHEDEHGAFDQHHEEGSWQCQLLDQLSHADGVAASLHGWTFATPRAAFAAPSAVPVRATCACGYHARGPPNFLA